MTNEANAEQQVQDNASPEAATPDVAALGAEVAKARDDMLRALAEAENTRRRAERQVAEARAFAIDRFATDLLPIADTLGRALAAAPQDSADEAIRNMIAGLEMTERTMIETLARHGVKRVGAKGQTFNPNLHQAVAQAPSDQPAGVILEVMQPGYALGDRTLRAAMVLVSGGGAQAPAPTVDVKV
ncbi:MAG: nucleotide exchange factor GrpE [Phycisphaerales bacterium]|nr:nucleotide exchange factor GrpE [Hyphomonadaceae bacterium]